MRDELEHFKSLEYWQKEELIEVYDANIKYTDHHAAMCNVMVFSKQQYNIPLSINEVRALLKIK